MKRPLSRPRIMHPTKSHCSRTVVNGRAHFKCAGRVARMILVAAVAVPPAIATAVVAQPAQRAQTKYTTTDAAQIFGECMGFARYYTPSSAPSNGLVERSRQAILVCSTLLSQAKSGRRRAIAERGLCIGYWAVSEYRLSAEHCKQATGMMGDDPIPYGRLGWDLLALHQYANARAAFMQSQQLGAKSQSPLDAQDPTAADGERIANQHLVSSKR